MVTAKQIINSIKPNITKVPTGKTQLGSAGYDNVRDDIEKVKKLREGSVEKVPANNSDIANKKYVDDNVFSKDHDDLTNVTASQHHTKYTDAEADARVDLKIDDGNSAGQMAFWNGSKWVKTETDELFWDDTNKRFGVGDSSPRVKLQIAGNSESAPSGLGIFRFDTDTGTADAGLKIGAHAGAGNIGYIFLQGIHTGVSNDGNIVFQVGGGNVGIGTTTPNEALTLGADGVLSIDERTSAPSNTAAYGKLWVKTATPNQLWFTDDAGTSTQIV